MPQLSHTPPTPEQHSSLDRSPLAFSPPLGSPSNDHAPPSAFSLTPFHPNPFELNPPAPPPPSVQPTSLPVPKRTLTNIWAQPIDSASSCAGSDLDLNSPLLGQIPMINRRFSHLSTSTQPHSQSLFNGSPIPDPIGPISLSTDRYRGSLTPTSPLSAGFGPNSLPSNFYQPWYDARSSSEALLSHDERMGRSRARDILGSRPTGSYRDPSVGSMGSPCSSSARSGIGLSNMSPFTGTSLLPPGGLSIGGSLASHNPELAYHRGRDSSLGAIGSGRMTSRSSVPNAGPIGSGLGLASSGSRVLNKASDHVFAGSVGTDSWLTGGRSLSNDLDEDDEFAQPTKSGATSRRHSVSAFTGRGLVQGFESILSRPNVHVSNASNDTKKMSREHSRSGDNRKDGGAKNERVDMFGRGSSALTDEDLCFTTDFNSLNLDLESQPSQDHNDRLSFQLSHQNHFNSPQLSFHPKSHYPEPHDTSAPPLNNMPWSSLSAVSREPMSNSTHSPRGGPGNFARKSSYSAGDPFSASAQASRYFASQAGTQHSIGSRIPLGHSGPNLQPLGSISSPSVTTFSASGLLSAPLPHSRQLLNPESDSKPSPFDPPSGNSFYPAPNSNPHFSPLSPMFQIPPGLSGSSPTTQYNAMLMPSPRPGTTPGLTANELNDLGKGIPLHQISRDCRLYIVEFKGGRTDLFYPSQQAKEVGETIQKGDLVIVEADRGQDLGKVVHDNISIDEVRKFQNQHTEMALDQINHPVLSQLPPQPAATDNVTAGSTNSFGDGNSSRLTKEIHPKKIFGKASQADIQSLLQKTEEERKALSLCRSKALQRGLQMEITSAEWQWDRRKLTFFFIADKRIDFRDLVKDLFRTWKTRIWMCSVNP